jgi:hypothetical protein
MIPEREMFVMQRREIKSYAMNLVTKETLIKRHISNTAVD